MKRLMLLTVAVLLLGRSSCEQAQVTGTSLHQRVSDTAQVVHKVPDKSKYECDGHEYEDKYDNKGNWIGTTLQTTVGNEFYKCDLATHKWVVDQKATNKLWEQAAKENKHREDLRFALQSRLLTDKEMKEVADYGTRLFEIEQYGMYSGPSEVELQKQLNEALLQQFRLRAVAAELERRLNEH